MVSKAELYSNGQLSLSIQRQGIMSTVSKVSEYGHETTLHEMSHRRNELEISGEDAEVSEAGTHGQSAVDGLINVRSWEIKIK